jgi:ubiquinone/menaquinone biosynthesis C-methylase UbiE
MKRTESMTESRSAIQRDFDRIALLSGESWNHNSHYHEFLLRQIPLRCESSLDIGCGTGAFSRLLADRSERIVALDLSPQMIQVARERSKAYPNIDFQVADVTAWEFPVAQFDCVASIATLHHLLLAETLVKMRDALRAGGVLVVLDLYQEEGLADLLTSAVAMIVHKVLFLLRTGRLTEPREVRDAWAEHGQHDSYLTLAEIRRICASVLPGARVRKHLLWRYSITWSKESGAGGTGL